VKERFAMLHKMRLSARSARLMDVADVVTHDAGPVKISRRIVTRNISRTLDHIPGLTIL
jgi:hypothetical protein